MQTATAQLRKPGQVGPEAWSEAPARETDTPRHGRRASGYGGRIPTRWQVWIGGRWRRVYVAQWSNAGTAYIGRSLREAVEIVEAVDE